jgi:putative addiction module killer protein
MLELRESELFKTWRADISDLRARAAIAARLTRLAAGLAGDAKPVGGGISELRVHYGPGYRIYFHRHGRTLILLLCGGDKSTQSKDIAKAKRLSEEWSEHHG